MEKNLNLKVNELMKEKNPISSIFSRNFSNSSDSYKIQPPRGDAKKDDHCSHSKNRKTAEAGFMIITLIIVILIIVLIAVVIGLFVSMIQKTGVGFNIQTIEKSIKEFLVKIFYSVAKWILCFVDIVFSYIKRLCGLNMDFSSLSGIFSAESDMIFNLLITAEDRALPVFKNLLVLTIVMIIVFTIIALIKAQLEAIQKMKPASVMDTIKRTVKAFVLLLITPFIAIGGIVFSDLLLQTLFNATNTTGAMTLGSQVFSSASVSANAYRTYASSNGRIPIVCDFTKEEEILEYYKNQPLSDTFTDYLQSSNNLIYVTYMSFVNKDFNKFSDLNDLIQGQNNPGALDIDNKSEYRDRVYYGIYDISLGESPSKNDVTKYSNDVLRRIEAYAEEYYVMADIIDFAVNTNNNLYMKTIEEVLDSIGQIPDESVASRKFDEIIKMYGIKFYSGISKNSDYKYAPEGQITSGGREFISLTDYKLKSWNVISYSSQYISPDDSGEPMFPMQIPYFHARGQTDELEGARYIMAVESTVKVGDSEYSYFEPMAVGYTGRYKKSFQSEYIMKGQIIAAKGTFKDSEFPTAIKQTADGNGNPQLCFYRENIESAAVGYANDLFRGNAANANKPSFLLMLQAFFDPESILGDLSVNAQAIQATYTGEKQNYSFLADGRMKLGYFFTFSPSDSPYSQGSGTLSFREIFIPCSFNLLLIVAAPILLVKVCLAAFMGLIQRSFELFLIIVMYPAACATIPLDDRAYNSWWREGYMQRLFSTYGLILGLNFVFMLFPIIMGIQYFKPADIATNKFMYKVCGLFFGFLTINQMTNLLNSTTAILFELVAFTLIETVPQTINRMVGAMDPKSDFMDGVKKVLSGVSKAIKIVGKIVGVVIGFIPHIAGMAKVAKGISKSEKAVKNFHKFQNFKRKLMPGSKFIDEVQKGKSEKEKARDTKKALSKLGSSLNNGSGVIDVDGSGKPIEPKKEDFLKKAGDDEELKQKAEKDYEAAMKKYQQDLDKYNKENTMGTKEHADAIKQQYQGLLDAQNAELQQINKSSDDIRNEKNDKKREDRLADYDGKNDDKDGDDDDAESNQKVDDGEEGGSGGGDSGEFDGKGYSNRDLRRSKHKTKKQHKKLVKRRKILEKRIKWEKKHGGDSTKFENALNGVESEIQNNEQKFNEIQGARLQRKDDKKAYKKAKREAKSPEEKAQIIAKRKQEKADLKAAKEQRKEKEAKHAKEVKQKRRDNRKVNRIKKRYAKRQLKLQEKNKKRMLLFAQTRGKLFTKLGNKIKRGAANHSLNRGYKKGTKRLVKLNKKLDKLNKLGDADDPKTQRKKAALQTEIGLLNQQVQTNADNKADLNNRYQKNKNIDISEKYDSGAGIRDAGFVKRAVRQIRHPIQMHRNRKMEGEMKKVNITEVENRNVKIQEEIKKLEEQLKGPVTNQQQRKTQLENRKKLNELTLELTRNKGLIERHEAWGDKNNRGFRKDWRRQKKGKPTEKK